MDGSLTIDNNIVTKCDKSVNNHMIIPEGIKKIKSRAFYYCTSLISITISESVTSIGGSAFEGCNNLSSINIPEGVKEIHSDAFSGCTSLTSITIPKSVTSIHEGAFQGCSGLTSITIPGSVKSIGDNAFKYCSNLASVVISEGVLSIGEGAFQQCNRLTEVTFPESATDIGDNIFRSCDRLTTVNIPYKTVYSFNMKTQPYAIFVRGLSLTTKNNLYDTFINNCLNIITSVVNANKDNRIDLPQELIDHIKSFCTVTFLKEQVIPQGSLESNSFLSSEEIQEKHTKYDELVEKYHRHHEKYSYSLKNNEEEPTVMQEDNFDF